MKIIETNNNVINFADLKSGDVFRDADTNKMFMKMLMAKPIETICGHCGNCCEYCLDDVAVNLETGEIEFFYMCDKVEKYNATLTINR